ncbi:MAG: DUF1295 domain-containing protein [Paludibacteraceae bacterium]|nr:DUF1295 domain-containing protein [Paludibacteraceae bacterium]
MEHIYTLSFFYNTLFVMALIGLVVFVALYFVDAGYGKMRTEKWGPAINNKVGWFLMEAPVFLVVLYLWSTAAANPALAVVKQAPYWIFLLIFELHYFQRSFIFPFLLKGNSKMPITIMFLSVLWNLINGYVQGYWLFHLAPQYRPELYSSDWMTDPRFIIGCAIFITGFIINLHSDHVIRHLRQPGDTNHYLPQKGLYRYVTSANYLGEITEWLGFAILTWSLAGLLFFWFSCCNLVPRSNSIYKKYAEEFPDQFDSKKLKRIIPFIY